MSKRKPSPKPDPTPSFDDVMALARRWYYTAIRRLVEDAIVRLQRERKPANENEAREWLTSDVDQTTFGHSFVIYDAMAWMVCAASDNVDAFEDEIGERPSTVEGQSCAAMRADAWELLEARSDEWIPTDGDS